MGVTNRMLIEQKQMKLYINAESITCDNISRYFVVADVTISKLTILIKLSSNAMTKICRGRNVGSLSAPGEHC